MFKTRFDSQPFYCRNGAKESRVLFYSRKNVLLMVPQPIVLLSSPVYYQQ